MKVRDVQAIIESWAPREIAWENDNTGFQCGDPTSQVRGILVALDATERVVVEARSRQANLVITHHPLLFRPLRSLGTDSPRGRVIRTLVRNDIALYSAHTNLDFTRGGTSFALAEALRLHDMEFLHRPYKIYKKIVTYVPAADIERVAEAMAEAGAGVIGNYDHCSFRIQGTGTFKGNARSVPHVGKRGNLEHVPETRLEMIAPAWKIDRVEQAMRKAHPYEAIAFEIYNSEQRSNEYGMGVIGDLRPSVSLRQFLASIKRALKVENVRFAGDPRLTVRRVAVCGGSGSDLLEEASRQRADVFVTADIKYHRFQEVPSGLALVDAGHFETELPVVQALVTRLRKDLHDAGERLAVSASRRSANPVQYF